MGAAHDPRPPSSCTCLHYSSGQGIPEDDVEAYKWLLLYKWRDELLDDVFMAFSCDPGLDALKDKMSVAQVAEGARRAKEWQAQHADLTK